MNKKIKIYIAAILGAFLFQSCDKFLDVEPYAYVDSSKAITNEENARAAVTGIYDALQNWRYYGRNFVVFGDVMSNNVMLSPTNSNRFVSGASWNWTISTADIADFWNRAYDAINRANSLINAENIQGDTDKINQMKGEAYALRALAHFDLVRIFAQNYNFTKDHSHLGVPYITKHVADGKPFRNTVAEVYANILADLAKAEEWVTTSRVNEPYTVSPDAIKAIFAKVYLYMDNFDKAKSYAEAVIPKYTLIPNGSYLDSWKMEYTSETIFGLHHSSVDGQGTNGLGYIYIEPGYGDLLVNPEFYNSYADGDIRKKWYVYGKASSKKDNLYAANKYPGRSTGTPGLDTYNIIRLSELYLIAAEANCKATAIDEDKARAYLDAIRKRAQPDASASTATGQALMDAILLEKRKELAFEGNYFHDQKRLQQTILGAVTGNSKYVTINYPDDRLAWPIPERETDANPNIATQQNPGY